MERGDETIVALYSGDLRISEERDSSLAWTPILRNEVVGWSDHEKSRIWLFPAKRVISPSKLNTVIEIGFSSSSSFPRNVRRKLGSSV